MSYSEIQRLQLAVQQEPSQDNLEELVHEELQFLDSQIRVRDEATQRAAAAEAELEQLRREIGRAHV